MSEVNWTELEEQHARIIKENVRLKAFYDNIQQLYHDTISNHESTISIHAIGDLLLKLGETKEVEII